MASLNSPLIWGGIPASSQLSLQLAAASASLRRVHSTRTSNGIQMALRLRVAPAAWRSMRRITRGRTATDAHASRARAPTAPQLLFPYQPSSPRSQAVLAGIGHLRIFSASSTCSDVAEGGLHQLNVLSHLSAASPRLARVVRLLAKTSRVS